MKNTTQKITSINISITDIGGKEIYSSISNCMFITLTKALSDFKNNMKRLKDEDPEKFKNIIIK